jgi:hypothetical protein
VTSVSVPCPLCGTPRGTDERCPECNLDPGFGPDATNPFRSGTLWATVGGLAAVYAVTLGVVALTR